MEIHGVEQLKSMPSLCEAADLVIADLPIGLPVPTVLVPSSIIPTWNEKSDDYLQELFDFVNEILHDNGVLLLIFPFDNGEFLEDIERFYDCFGFAMSKKLIGSISCPLARQRFPIPLRTDSISLFSSGFCKPRTPCLTLLHFSFIMYQSWWRKM